MAYKKPENKEKPDVYQIVTDRILEKLEQGVVPWHKPWDAKTGMPCNIITGKEYNGINLMLLGSQAYDSKYWLTFKQCQEKGGYVKKGEKSSMIVYWNFVERNTDKITDTDKDHATPAASKGVVPILRFYHVFNVNQTEGLDLKRLKEEMDTAKNGTAQVEEITPAHQIVEQYQDKPEIKYGFTRACYRPLDDEINMPRPENFKSPEEFYSTLFHEMVHSTGHEERLNRKNSSEVSTFGDEAYSKEELVAEMGASFLCARAGIENKTIDNSAAYIQSWMKALHNDKKLLVTAAGQAQKSVNYISGDLELSQDKQQAQAQDSIKPDPYYHTVCIPWDKNKIHKIYENEAHAERYIDIMNTKPDGSKELNFIQSKIDKNFKNDTTITPDNFNEHEIMREWSKKYSSIAFPTQEMMKEKQFDSSFTDKILQTSTMKTIWNSDGTDGPVLITAPPTRQAAGGRGR